MSPQYLWAITITAVYLLLCWRCLRRPDTTVLPDARTTAHDRVLIAYASQSGHAEKLARHYAESMQNHHGVLVVPLNNLDQNLMHNIHTALFIVSTYGEGEPPDNGVRFHRQWLRKPEARRLAHMQYAVLALGDSSYSHYCGFGNALAEGLGLQGATPLFDTIKVDDMNSEDLVAWQQQLSASGFLAEDAIHAPRELPFHSGRLGLQTCLNPGSPGEPAYHINIAPPAEISQWQAGDILEILPANDPDISPREYSIASIPADGGIDLLVRLTYREDGSTGLGSGWLTQQAVPGSKVLVRLRDNPAFHPPASDMPMILIGNGTGLAGLRAHLKARQQAGAKQNALFFGERSSAHDRFFHNEIESWQAQNFLPECHLCFSRDEGDKRYVQDLLGEKATLIRDWVKDGSAIYVCGSLEGMASGVDAVLADILGASLLESMKIAGTYARDVY